MCADKCVPSVLSQHNHSPLWCPFRDCEGERECKVVWDTSEIYLMSGLLHTYTYTHSVPEALLDYTRGGLKFTILGGGCTLGSVCDKCGYHETSFGNEIHDTQMYRMQNLNDQHVFRTVQYSSVQCLCVALKSVMLPSGLPDCNISTFYEWAITFAIIEKVKQEYIIFRASQSLDSIFFGIFMEERKS